MTYEELEAEFRKLVERITPCMWSERSNFTEPCNYSAEIGLAEFVRLTRLLGKLDARLKETEPTP